jgi:hypothetical protein
MKNCGGGAAHRRQLRHRFLVMQRRKTQLLRPLAGAEGHRSGGSAAEQGRRAAEQGGRGAWASVAAAGVRVRVQRGSELPFVGRRSNTGARARGEKAAGDLGVVAR